MFLDDIENKILERILFVGSLNVLDNWYIVVEVILFGMFGRINL